MNEDFFACVDGERTVGRDRLAKVGIVVRSATSRYPGGVRRRWSVRNVGPAARWIERVGVTLTFPRRSARRRQWRVFLDQGACGWCGVKPLEALEPDPRLQPVREQRLSDKLEKAPPFHRSDLQTVVWDAKSGRSTLVGFLRQVHGSNKIDVIPNRRAADIDRFEAWQDVQVTLAPRAAQALDELVVAEGDDPYAMLERFGTEVRKHHGRTFNEPPIVGMMTWYGLRTAIDEQMILENAKIVGELFGGYPQKMQNLMLLDNGWQANANWGHWRADKKRFSHGMKWLCDRLARRGMRLGLWCTPFCITNDAPRLLGRKSLSHLEAKDADGHSRTGRPSGWGDLPGHSTQRTVTFFDGAHDAVQKKWGDELRRMRKWGCRYWKLDFFVLQTSAGNERNISPGQLYSNTWSSFRRGAGARGHLAPCSCRTNAQLGYCDSIRIGADIGNAGSWPGAWQGYRHGMSTTAALWYKHRNFWVNDADSIQIGKGCSLSEVRVRATMVAFSGGHLMLSEDLRGVATERLEMIRRLLPACPVAARPVDLFENPFPDRYPSIWALTIDSALGKTTALAIFNLAGETRSWTIEPSMLGIKSGRKFAALEWWNSKWLGIFDKPFTIDVPPEDVAIIHAGPAKRVPSLVSVSHHHTGSYIVEACSFDSRTGTLRGVLATKRGLHLVLFGHTADGWALTRHARWHASASSAGGWQSELRTTGSRTRFEIAFAKCR